MQISILLAQQITQLFLILLMGYAVVKTGLLKASDSKVVSVLMVYLVCPCMILNATTRPRSAGALFTPWPLRRRCMWCCWP